VEQKKRVKKSAKYALKENFLPCKNGKQKKNTHKNA